MSNNEKTYNIKVKITDINVNDYCYSFNYKIYLEGKLYRNEYYEAKHKRKNDQSIIKKQLKDGGALKIVLDKIEIGE